MPLADKYQLSLDKDKTEKENKETLKNSIKSVACLCVSGTILNLNRFLCQMLQKNNYGILDFFRGISNDSQDLIIHLILFEDGFVFYHPFFTASYEKVCFDNNSVSDNYGDYRVSLDDWLVSNLKKINR